MPPRKGGNPFASLGGTKQTGGAIRGNITFRKGPGKKKKAKAPVDPGILELRKCRKKLKEIIGLECRLQPLNSDQKQKIALKATIEARIQELEKEFPWCKQQPAQVKAQVQQKSRPGGSSNFTVSGKLMPKSPKKAPALPKNHVVTLPSEKRAEKTKGGTAESRPGSLTSLRKRLKGLKKEFKKIGNAERKAKLGQILTEEDKNLLENKLDMEDEIKTLRKKCEQMVKDNQITLKEKTDLLGKLQKQLAACDLSEAKLSRGEKLTKDEEKQLQRKPGMLKELGMLKAVTPIDVLEAMRQVPKKKRLGDLPEGVRKQMFEIDKRLRVLKQQLKESLDLETRFNKRGGKPLSMPELRKMNTKERVQNEIAKLEEEGRALLRKA